MKTRFSHLPLLYSQSIMTVFLDGKCSPRTGGLREEFGDHCGWTIPETSKLPQCVYHITVKAVISDPFIQWPSSIFFFKTSEMRATRRWPFGDTWSGQESWNLISFLCWWVIRGTLIFGESLYGMSLMALFHNSSAESFDCVNRPLR